MSNPSVSLIAIQHESEESVTVTKHTIYKETRYPFVMLGRAGRGKGGITGMNMYSILKDLSAGASWAFWSLQEIRDQETNISDTRDVCWSPADKKKMARAYKELVDAGLVVRTKQHRYMTNPKAVQANKDSTALYEQWTLVRKAKGLLP